MIPEHGSTEDCKACVLVECAALPVIWGRYHFAFDRDHGFFTLHPAQSWKVVGLNYNYVGALCVGFTLSGAAVHCVAFDDWMTWAEQGHILRLEDRDDDDGIDRSMEAWFDFCCHQQEGVMPTYNLQGPSGRIETWPRA